MMLTVTFAFQKTAARIELHDRALAFSQTSSGYRGESNQPAAFTPFNV
jgi:hypothetical protein